jgi:hypothetical protein
MKKLFALFVAAGILAFMACGGGADKAKEQKIKDSLKKDSIAKIDKQKAKDDSIKAAEEAAKAADTLKKKEGDKKDGPKKPDQPKK